MSPHGPNPEIARFASERISLGESSEQANKGGGLAVLAAGVFLEAHLGGEPEMNF